jgi:general secretion pathway protein K
MAQHGSGGGGARPHPVGLDLERRAGLGAPDPARGQGSHDHLGEPWAITLQEARLSSFLAADRNTVDAGAEVMDAFLSGQIVDMHSMLNVYNLVAADGKANEGSVDAFAQLFDLLGLPLEQLDQLVANMVLARKAATQPGAEAPLMPQRMEQLAWLGLSAQTVSALKPYATLLDPNSDPTPVNLNTASAEVIYAALPGSTMAEARAVVAARDATYFQSRPDAMRLLNDSTRRFPEGQGQAVGVQSQFFEVRSRLRLDQLVVEERALVRRLGIGGAVTVIRRERGAPSSTIDAGSPAPR